MPCLENLILAASFARGAKSLVVATPLRTVFLSSERHDTASRRAFDTLSLIERYETLPAVLTSVGYGYIEAHGHETRVGARSESPLPELRSWLT